jgi:CheY-like chemotaxis protein
MEPSNTPNDSLVVLWTDDDENDRFMIEVVLARAPRPVSLKFVEDGEQAWDYLCGKGKYADRDKFPLPHAVITDLKMPRCDGFELVERIRADENLARLPVLVFSASDLACDRGAAQRLGVDVYITKPNGFGCWTTTILDLIDHATMHLSGAVASGH